MQRLVVSHRWTLLLFLATTCLQADTVRFREAGGRGCLDVPFDCTHIDRTSDGLRAEDTFELKVSRPWYALIGVKGLFAELPLDGGQNIVRASLTLHAYWGDGDTITVYRCLTDWMTARPGESQARVTGNRVSVDENIGWSDGAFGRADYDAANGVSITFDQSCYRKPYVYDVTGMVRAMYDSRMNFGFVVTAAHKTRARVYPNAIPHRSPSLEIEYFHTPRGSFSEPAGGGLTARGRVFSKSTTRLQTLCLGRPEKAGSRGSCLSPMARAGMERTGIGRLPAESREESGYE